MSTSHVRVQAGAPGKAQARQQALAWPLRVGVRLGMVAALLLLCAPVALAAPPAQDGEPFPILLGEMASATVAAGESISYTFDAPDDTVYVITSGDDAEAAKFNLVITSDRGDEVYNDVFQTAEIELDDGDYIVEATANEAGVFSFFVTGEIGDLTDNSSRPGDMVNGGFVTVEGVEGTLYAELDIDDTDTWQRAFIYFQGGEGDAYSAYVSGENIYESISDSSSEPPLSFWTKGGRYTVEVTPTEGGDSLTLVPLLSGPVPFIEVGSEVAGSLGAGANEKAYRFAIDEPNRVVNVTLASDNEDLDAELVVSIDPTSDTWGSFNYGSNESVSFAAPQAGEYIVRVYSTSALEDTLDYTLLVELGDAAVLLEPNTQVWGTVPAGGAQLYSLNVEEANELLTLVMVAGSNQDLDLTAQQVDENGSVVASLSAYSSGSTEIMAQTVSTPGVYEVRVSGRYASEDTSYVLDVRLESADEVGAQWATEASASSQFGEDSWSATQATGEPTITEPTDNPAAWASAEPDGSVETLELGYEHKVTPTGVQIHESFNPGAVTMVEAYNEDDDEWVSLWEGEEPSDSDIRVFEPQFDAPEFKTNRIRLTIDSDLVSGYNEIDAVRLLGLP